MNGRLEHKVAVVVGATQGIGAAIARRFIEEGASVAIGDLDTEAGAAMVAGLGPEQAMFARADVSRKDEVAALVEGALERFGRIDILVQNAGIFPVHLIETMSLEQWQRVVGVNLTGTFLAAQACLAPMKAVGGGRMVFTSSITGPRVAALGMAAYCASKAGINGFIRAAALEFARHGITVNGVEPGNILTEGVAAARSEAFIRGMAKAIPLGRLGAPRDVADAALFLASDEASFITGTTLIVDGGQILPESEDALSEEAWK